MNKKDTRDKLWSELEIEIQNRSLKKDKSFLLAGKWKKLVRKDGNFKIYAVDGRWVRSNICIYFGHGGHGLVHEFIPINEIWISTRHYNEGKASILRCNCKTKRKNQKVSNAYFESTVLHEIEELKQMKKGKNYWNSHRVALQRERKAGLLKDPYNDC